MISELSRNEWPKPDLDSVNLLEILDLLPFDSGIKLAELQKFAYDHINPSIKNAIMLGFSVGATSLSIIDSSQAIISQHPIDASLIIVNLVKGGVVGAVTGYMVYSSEIEKQRRGINDAVLEMAWSMLPSEDQKTILASIAADSK
jgi:hypothetical protein